MFVSIGGDPRHQCVFVLITPDVLHRAERNDGNDDESGIEDDLTTAQRYAAAAGGPDGAKASAALDAIETAMAGA